MGLISTATHANGFVKVVEDGAEGFVNMALVGAGPPGWVALGVKTLATVALGGDLKGELLDVGLSLVGAKVVGPLLGKLGGTVAGELGGQEVAVQVGEKAGQMAGNAVVGEAKKVANGSEEGDGLPSLTDLFRTREPEFVEAANAGVSNVAASAR